jgi:hypothetical protein
MSSIQSAIIQSKFFPRIWLRLTIFFNFAAITFSACAQLNRPYVSRFFSAILASHSFPTLLDTHGRHTRYPLRTSWLFFFVDANNCNPIEPQIMLQREDSILDLSSPSHAPKLLD